jgi:ABC transporter with metal-binding/Fe-S-binding domain ATP-binding protein
MFHYPNVEWTRLQAETIGIPQVTASTSGVKEEELGAMKRALLELKRTHGIDCVVTGAIASEYQKWQIEGVCHELGLRSVAPLWRKDPGDLLVEQVAMGFEFILTACMAMGLGPDWLGRRIDNRAIDELRGISKRYGVSLVFEGGEAETYVLNAPIFKRRIRIAEAHPVWKGDSGHLNIVRASLSDDLG